MVRQALVATTTKKHRCAPVAQLLEHRAAMREVVSSTKMYKGENCCKKSLLKLEELQYSSALSRGGYYTQNLVGVFCWGSTLVILNMTEEP